METLESVFQAEAATICLARVRTVEIRLYAKKPPTDNNATPPATGIKMMAHNGNSLLLEGDEGDVEAETVAPGTGIGITGFPGFGFAG